MESRLSAGVVGAGASRVVFNAANGTNYRVAVDGFALRPGNQGTFALTWHRPVAPEMSIQPQSHTNTVGDNVTFSAVAVGIPDAWYQWKFNVTNTISGATNSSYAKLNVQTNDMGSYTVVCTNLSGSVTSQVAYLQVYETSASDLTTAAITNGNQMKFYLSANTNLIYVIDASTNLINWVPIKTNNAPFLYLDPQTITNHPQRFYRARYQP